MIDALVAGRLSGKANLVTGKSGISFVRARVRADTNRGGATTVTVTAFEEAVREVLLTLEHGDSVALTGPIVAKLWRDKAGETQQSLDMTAVAVLTPFHVGRKRKAATLPDDSKLMPVSKSSPLGEQALGDQADRADDSAKKRRGGRRMVDANPPTTSKEQGV
jgi:single-stranded DNA-binding protein